ncbi:delta-60 repeat domain-containing protein [Pseudomonas kielensis]|uniref:delta-60 repeat domain-containing protein n=1 Tax=Pseudomonas kielensis TaxID=2762577 RepID=UPI0038A7D40F
MAQAPSTIQAGTLDPTFAEEGVLTLPTPELIGPRTLALLPLAENKLLITVLLPEKPGSFGLAKVNEDGSIDMEFGGGTGVVEFSKADTNLETISHLSGLSDGGWLVIGEYGSPSGAGSYVVRFLQSGQPDTRFGEDGVRLLPFRPESRGGEDGPVTFSRRDREASAQTPLSSGNNGPFAVVQPDGKIVLRSAVFIGTDVRWVVLRLNPDGSTDYTFNGTGSVDIVFPGIPRVARSAKGIVLQADGKVLVFGEYSQTTPDSRGIYVIRLDATGHFDTDFNAGTGFVTVPNLSNANAVALRESDGAILVAGDTWPNPEQGYDRHGLIFVLSRDGFFDFAFNSGQPLFSKLVDKGHDWHRCAWQADGSIVVAGTTGRGLVEKGVSALTARFRSDGSLDLTFNGSGFVLFDEEVYDETVEVMALMPDGRIVVGGFRQLPAPVWGRFFGSWFIRYLA